MLLRVGRESQHIQLLKLSKSWHFKYKSKATGDFNPRYNVVGDPKDTEVGQLIPETLGQQVYLIHAEKRPKRWLVMCMPCFMMLLLSLGMDVSDAWNKRQYFEGHKKSQGKSRDRYQQGMMLDQSHRSCLLCTLKKMEFSREKNVNEIKQRGSREQKLQVFNVFRKMGLQGFSLIVYGVQTCVSHLRLRLNMGHNVTMSSCSDLSG
ncbi:hypothetical protein Bca4012_054602 [Brassica carinata]